MVYQAWWVIGVLVGLAVGAFMLLYRKEFGNWVYAINPISAAILCLFCLLAGKQRGLATLQEAEMYSVILAAVASVSITIVFSDN